MRRLIILLFILSSVLSASVLSKQTKHNDENNHTIRLLLNDWASQAVMTKITGRLFEKLGYHVEYLESNVDGQWYQLKFMNVDIQVEVWEGTMAKKYHQLIKSGDIVDAGEHAAKTREDWWYPDYIEEQCPGLPDWRALKKCFKIFITTESEPLGQYVGGPWEKPDAARIRALELPFKIIQAKDSNELKTRLEAAVKRQSPILIFNWTPNYIEAEIPGKFIEFPEYTPECEQTASWGYSKVFPWDCGNPKGGWLKKVVRKGFKQERPCAYAVLTEISFTSKMIALLSKLVDVDGLSSTAAADLWIANNKKIWRNWIKGYKHCQL